MARALRYLQGERRRGPPVTVAAVYPGYIVVEKGFFFPTDYYIPMSAVASYDNDRVYLTSGQRCGPEQRLGCSGHRSGDRHLRHRDGDGLDGHS